MFLFGGEEERGCMFLTGMLLFLRVLLDLFQEGDPLSERKEGDRSVRGFRICLFEHAV